MYDCLIGFAKSLVSKHPTVEIERGEKCYRVSFVKQHIIDDINIYELCSKRKIFKWKLISKEMDVFNSCKLWKKVCNGEGITKDDILHLTLDDEPNDSLWQKANLVLDKYLSDQEKAVRLATAKKRQEDFLRDRKE